MRSIHIPRLVVAVSLLLALPVLGQQQKPASERTEATVRSVRAAEPETPATSSLPAQGNQAAAPRLVKVSGVLTEFVRNSVSSSVEMTFGVYKDEVGGEALWTETQSVEVDKEGRYTVLLGAAQAEGVPVELFPAGEPRWLGVEIRGQASQSRTLLVSVPYALKALDAEKLSGKSLSDFVLSESFGEQVRQVIQAQGQSAGQSALAGAQQKQTGTSSPTPPQTASAGPTLPPTTFSGANATQIVQVTQFGTGQGLAAFTGPAGGNGVFGQTAGTNASGVFGNATSTATSSFQNGVLGLNAGAGAGVAGIGTNPSAGIGIYGQGANCCGIVGNAVATSGFNCGLCGDGSPSPNGSGVFGSAFQWVGVGGQATAPSGGPAFGVWGDSLSTGGVGVAGFEDATSGYTNGVMGTSVSPNGNGVLGVNNSNTGNYNNGVLGINNATTGNAYGVNGSTQTTGFGAGVAGQAFATTGNAFGVFGQSNSPNGNAMFGHAVAGSGFPTAVVGFLDGSTGGVAGQFVAHTGAGLILQGLSGPSFNQVFSVDANGNLNISGNLVVNGTKSSTARLQSGREVALYAVESPENWFEDFGSAELKSGAAWVPLEASFAEATNAAVTYHVFLTPNGDSNGLYVARKTATGFEVREHGGGTSNVAFDYRIVVRRRGYEAVRMAEVQHDVKIADASRQHLAEFVSSGVPKAAAIKPPRNIQAPAILPTASGPRAPEVPKQAIPQLPKMSAPQLPQLNVTQAPKGSVPQPPQPR